MIEYKSTDSQNDKTITSLKSHAWYRFLKVVFFLTLLATLTLFNAFAFSGIGRNVNEVLIYGNLAILGLFEVIRRIFYYVVLGKVIPEK